MSRILVVGSVCKHRFSPPTGWIVNSHVRDDHYEYIKLPIKKKARSRPCRIANLYISFMTDDDLPEPIYFNVTLVIRDIQSGKSIPFREGFRQINPVSRNGNTATCGLNYKHFKDILKDVLFTDSHEFAVIIHFSSSYRAENGLVPRPICLRRSAVTFSYEVCKVYPTSDIIPDIG
jgi:hypothetical protein